MILLDRCQAFLLLLLMESGQLLEFASQRLSLFFSLVISNALNVLDVYFVLALSARVHKQDIRWHFTQAHALSVFFQ